MISRNGERPESFENAVMKRDDTVAALLRRRFAANDNVQREAATVLLDLCRDGMSDPEIAAAVHNAANLPGELLQEIKVVAREIGISLK